MKPEVCACWVQSFCNPVSTKNDLVSFLETFLALKDPVVATLQKSKHSWLPIILYWDTDPFKETR